MQSSAELKTQIDQINRESRDIKNSLHRLTSTTDLLDAQQELKNRADVLVLLEQRLKDALDRERRWAEQNRRKELEAERVAAREDFDRLTERFDAEAEPLIEHIVRGLDGLTEIAVQRQQAHNRHLDAANQLGWGTIWGTRELGTDFGWGVKDAKDKGDPTGVIRALFPLFAARRGIDLSPEGQARAEYMRVLLSQPRPQNPAPTPLPDIVELATQAGVTLPFDQ